MMLADTMAVFFSVVGLLLALPCLWLTFLALFPQSVTRTAHICQDKLWLSFVIGLPFAILLVICVGIFSKMPEGSGGIFSILCIAVFLLLANLGFAGLASTIGARLPSPRDLERPWLSTLRGGVLLELSFVVPIVGWFLLLPVSLLIGVGAFVRSICRRSAA